MVEFSIRVAMVTDFPSIRSLILEVHINPFGLNWRHFLVAVSSDDKMLGCGQIKQH
jgi:hypothetical protein